MQIKNIKPFNDLVLVKPIEEGETGGIALPDVSKQTPQIGEVVVVGTASASLLNKKVLYRRWAGDELTLNKDMVILLSAEDILGEIEI